eukprot:m.67660 g.67660  ORF g.67660 m.67660 type:complete len:492 (+) comp14127_c0_seq1:29-1504(+)
MERGELFEPLVEELTFDKATAQHHRKACKHGPRPKMALFAAAVGVLAVLALVFVGGFFSGKARSGKCSSPAMPVSSQAVFAASLAGETATVAALQGNVPVDSFVQCHLLTTSSGTVCSPSNPLISQQSTLQITAYQFGSDLSLIVTAAGRAFGTANSSGTADFSFTLHVTGLSAAVMRLGDPFAQDFGRTEITAGTDYAVPFAVLDSSSQGVVFTWVNISAATPASFYITDLAGTAPIFELMGTTGMVFPALPSQAAPLNLRMAQEVVIPTASAVAETSVASSSTATLTRPSTLQRRRRALGGNQAHLLAAVEIKNPATNAVTARAEFAFNNRTGGGLAGLQIDVINYVLGKHAVLSVYQNRYLQQYGNVSSTFVSTLLLNDDITRNMPANSTVTQWYPGSWPKKYLTGQTSVPQWVRDTLSQVHTETTALREQIQSHRRRRSFWGCAWDVASGAVDGAQCGMDIYDCDVFGAVDDCFSTGEDVYHAYHDC